tara:strand:+ start:800 stop:1381 length:582 start_codon:yes stop_codon:yes gene_type:complete
MALDLKLDIQTTKDCRTLVIEDITRNYSEDNLGGWGGANIEPFKVRLKIDVIVRYYAMATIGSSQEEQMEVFEGIFNLDVYENFIETPSEDSYKNFKLALPFASIVEAIDDMEFIEYEDIRDGIYQIIIRVSNKNNLSEEYSLQEFQFKNICGLSKLVSKTLTSVNLACEDCDDTDLEKALLAKSLLESLDSI